MERVFQDVSTLSPSLFMAPNDMEDDKGADETTCEGSGGGEIFDDNNSDDDDDDDDDA
jgi:hypothetical protein